MIRRYEKYKNTGIEWLEEVPSEWSVKKLKYVADINPIKDHTIDSNSGEMVTFLPMERVGQNGEIDCEIKRSISDLWKGFTFFKKNDVILAKITPCFENGKGAYLYNLDTEIGFGSTEFHVIRAKKELYPGFLYYITKSAIFMKVGEAFMTGAAGQKRVPTEFIAEFALAFPNVLEQSIIASYLVRKTSEIEQLIDQKEKLIILYEEEKRVIINQAITQGLDPNVKLRSSGIEFIGDIPEHWELKRLKYIVLKVGSGVTPRGGASVYKLRGIPLLRSQNIHFSGLKLEDVAYITEETHNEMGNSKVFIGDVLLNITGASIGRCYFADDSLGEANVNQHVCIIRPMSEINTKYLCLLMRSDIGQIQIDIEQTGSGREGLNFESIKNFLLPITTYEEQIAIVAYIEFQCNRLDTIIDKFKKQIELFKEYRTTLISEVITGKIDVRDEVAI
jgi:type I restriction enzyme S subunit